MSSNGLVSPANPQPPVVDDVKLVSASEGYGLWASSYDNGRSPLLALEQRYLEPLLPAIEGREILDVGCGTGRWLEWLLQRGATRVYGADFSAEMLRYAIRKKQLAGRVVRASGVALPFQNSQFDLVLSSFMIGHIQSVTRVAGEIARVTRPGAQFFLSDFHPQALSRGWKRSFRAHGQVFEVATARHRLDDICERFENRGFRLLQRMECCFGEPEREIFERSGKAAYFAEQSQQPALYLLHFERMGTPSKPRPKVKATSVPVRNSASSAGTVCLTGARVALDANTTTHATVAIQDGKTYLLDADARSPGDSACVDLSGYLLLPGLINAHDHLEFNLFPRLGGRIYRNYIEWANDIYRPERSPVREHIAVPKPVRLWWGGIKNLLSGVTTVAHHNPFYPDVFTAEFPVRVVRRYGWAHSVAMGGDLRTAYVDTPPDAPFIIHAAEGSDARCSQEIRVLDSLGVLRENTVLVHGVAIDEPGHALLRRRQAALIWCPSTNLFMLGTTIPRDIAAGNEHIVLGSDSGLTAEGDLLDEIRIAQRNSGISAATLFEKVTTASARVLQLHSGEGAIRDGGVADLIAVLDRQMSPAEVVVSSDFHSIELVITGGRPNLMSLPMQSRWQATPAPELEAIWVEGEQRMIAAPLANMFRETAAHLGEDFRLAGKRVTI